MIVLLTEEASMRVTLEALIRKHRPDLVEGVHWWVLSFNGKTDLEKNIPHKMRRWNFGNPMFVVLRDNDGSDCKVLKQHLEGLASPIGRPFRVRLVCQELEGWFLGDNQAVTAAYPHCVFSNATAKYRDPDRMTNASQELEKLTGDSSKVERASLIAPHLDPSRNVSRSFQVLFKTLQQHLG